MLDEIVVLEGLTRTFGKRTAVDNLNLRMTKREIFGLLGPNGSGKTTTINMINGLLRPSSGRVLVQGMNPAQETSRVRALLGVVPQETALYDDLTGRENLDFHAGFYGVPPGERKARIEQLLDLVELTGRQHERVRAYSGGMKRRLALARSLLTEPPVIMLDEPTLGVDVQSRNALWQYILQLRDAGRTIILSTNIMEEAEHLCDRLAILDHGQLITQGSPNELTSSVGEHILELQVSDPEAALPIIQALPDVHSVTSQQDRLRLDVSNGPRLLPVLIAKLGEQHITINGIDLREPSLNDVFLKLTGKKLRD